MAKISLIFVILFSVFCLVTCVRTKSGSIIREDANYPSSEVTTNGDTICSSLVKKQGYTCEEHSVTTQDGYILSMQRIPGGQSNSSSPGNRPPVFLQHGLLVDGATWLFLPPNQSLALVLADSGFDVWIANTRGTRYSLQHRSLSPNSSDYWNWSWDELAAYDLSATIKYVKNNTRQNIHFIGHSQGTLLALAAFSRQELVDNVRSASLLSPIAYLSHVTSRVARIIAKNHFAEGLLKSGYYEFDLSSGSPWRELLNLFCHPNCSNLIKLYTGPNCCQSPLIDTIFFEYEPQSAATKNLVQLSQMIRNRNTTMFDYMDNDENTKHYGQSSSPPYEISRIPKDLPLFLSHGGADALSVVEDVKLLLQDLQGRDQDKLVVKFVDEYAHMDFIFGVNAKQLVYDPLITFIQRY